MYLAQRLVPADVNYLYTNSTQWSKTTSEWNTAARLVCGNDVIEVLPYATRDLALVLERGFELLFGIQPTDWSEATICERLRRISA